MAQNEDLQLLRATLAAEQPNEREQVPDNEAGPEGLEILVIGAPNLGEDPREDVDGQRDWWAD